MRRLFLTAAAVLVVGAAWAQDAEVTVAGKKGAIKGTIQEEGPAGTPEAPGPEAPVLPQRGEARERQPHLPTWGLPVR